MLAKLLAFFKNLLSGQAATDARDDEAAYKTLNQQAPLRQTITANEAEQSGNTFLCRETVLGRDQRIAGYQFMLQEATRDRIRSGSRRIRHVYAEVLVLTLIRANIERLLGHRLAFLDVPSSFLNHPCLSGLPPKNTVLVVEHLDDDAPPDDELLAAVGRLRAAGFRIAIPDPTIVTTCEPLLPQADIVFAQVAASNPEHLHRLIKYLAGLPKPVTLLMRNLPGQEDFHFCFQLGAHLFQGPFITRREDWQEKPFGPNAARLTTLLSRLRENTDTTELVEWLKHDAALSLRLLRYINSAASGLRSPVTSIEHALVMLGRNRLRRWLILLLCTTDRNSPRASAMLENALVRARMMETMVRGRPQEETDALFLTGLVSLIDIVLEVPMSRAVSILAVPAEIEAAVLRNEGPYAALLQLAAACESTGNDDLAQAAERCGVTPTAATMCHLDALAWALSFEE